MNKTGVKILVGWVILHVCQELVMIPCKDTNVNRIDPGARIPLCWQVKNRTVSPVTVDKKAPHIWTKEQAQQLLEDLRPEPNCTFEMQKVK